MNSTNVGGAVEGCVANMIFGCLPLRTGWGCSATRRPRNALSVPVEIRVSQPFSAFSSAGTTVDPVDELITLGDKTWRFIDTAGIRKRVKEASGHEYYASLRTTTAIDRAEVAVLVIDGSDSISEQDVRILQTVREAGRALVIAFNKWDLVDEERRHYLEREIDKELVQVPWAPRANVSARTGRHMDRLVPAIETALESWDTRVPTGRLNAFLGEIVAAHPHPLRGGKQPRILFATQASTRPPRFVIFASGFIERRLREQFGFEGTPIEVSVRVREKRRR